MSEASTLPARASAQRLKDALDEADARHLRRRRRILDSAQGPAVDCGREHLVNFSSNDYLGLADHPRLKEAAAQALAQYGVGAGASPLVSGHMRLHDEAEARFASFVRAPRALLFGSGYAANLGVLAALGGEDAEVFSDRLNHASLIDGARLSRSKVTVFAHRDAGSLADALQASRATTRIVATDAVFSMDGDLAPLPDLLSLCERYDAWLVVDDAHGIGVLGPGGRGTPSHFGLASPRIVHMATLGKALGGYGAFVAGAPDLVEWLVQRSRTYIYSTALPPMMAAVAMAALDLVEEEPAIVSRLHERIARFRAASARIPLAADASATAIQPVVAGRADRALQWSQRLRSRGFLVPAMRPPTVAEGSSRLRVSLSAAHSPAQLDALAAALEECARP